MSIGEHDSRLILGSWRVLDWQYSTSELLNFIEACLDLDVSTLDFADIYGDYDAETRFGEVFAIKPGLRTRLRCIGKTGIKLLSSKFPERQVKHYDTSRGHIVAAVDQTLTALHTDYLDTLLIHRPDPLMDADEVAETFIALRNAGKVREFGVSNFSPSQVELLQSRLPFPLVANQIEISLGHTAPLFDGTLDQCQRLRITPQAWSPLGGGRLLTQDSPVKQIALDVGRDLGGASLSQVALAWLLAHPAQIQPILGTGKLANVQDAVRASQLELSREQWFMLLEATLGHEVP
ncbi:aldo/keto reductase [Chitinivorax sp. B]|uniref:aldo/keto reductase n=1 Tax=Chitinivorax sp. B TaxID=2502235 RepID=UPI0010F9DD42|nr:aldo/keto reductase [Chitinivorax sp. B]